MVRFRRTAAVLVAVALCFGVAVATAAGDDRSAAESALAEANAAPEKAAAADVVAKAKAALDRGARLRSGGDETHARQADSLARAWAETARDVVRAAAVENRSAGARAGAVDAGLQADRERSLLEEAIAQSGRLRAQLDAVERDGKDQPVRTSTAANAPTKRNNASKDGGAPASPSSRPTTDRPTTDRPTTDGGAR